MHMLFQCLMLFFLVSFFPATIGTGNLDIVSILDSKSAAACKLKIHSIVESAEVKEILSFNFLLMPDDQLTENQWKSAFHGCFSNIRFEVKVWQRPGSLVYLNGKAFDKEVIYARFYLPGIFPHLKRFIYLDNDLVVTSDLYSLYSHKLLQSDDIPGSEEATGISTPVVNPRTVDRQGMRPQIPSYHKKHNQYGASATVAFVYERHPGYRDYIRAHFNVSHSFVRSVVEARGADAFLNGGVFIVDAVRWRKIHMTTQIERFLRRNEAEHMYSSEAVGDQGPFLLMFLNDTTYLPPKYNMRRLPKKTVNMLNDGVTGTYCFTFLHTDICTFYYPVFCIIV